MERRRRRSSAPPRGGGSARPRGAGLGWAGLWRRLTDKRAALDTPPPGRFCDGRACSSSASSACCCCCCCCCCCRRRRRRRCSLLREPREDPCCRPRSRVTVG
eukprot:scaffold1690_cov366-Prasinococcus_capsulatus_cf.AAC.1